jgi:hypothetical protein
VKNASYEAPHYAISPHHKNKNMILQGEMDKYKGGEGGKCYTLLVLSRKAWSSGVD